VHRQAKDIAAAYAKLSPVDLGKGFKYQDPDADRTFWDAVAVYGDVFFHLGRRAFLRNAHSHGVPA
jgi:hypothetical protein